MNDRTRNGQSRRDFLAGVGLSAAALTSGIGLAASQSAGGPGRARSGKVRIGVVGGGFGRYFQWHLHPDAEVVALCDVREERLNALKETYKSGELYRSYDEFLTHPGLEAVALFTPAPFHAEMAAKALTSGKHVISAVPAGMSVEELEMLLETVQRTGLKYMMAETSRYNQDVLTCIDLKNQGHFGEIFYTESEYHHSGLAPYAYGEAFDCQSCVMITKIDQVDMSKRVDIGKLKPTWSWGYPPMLYPTHCTGMIIPVTGERFTEVTAYGWGDGHEMLKQNTYDNNPYFHTVGLFKTTKGHCSRISIGWHIAAGGTERAVFYGDRGSFIMDRPEGSPSTIVKQMDTPDLPFGLHTGIIESKVAEERSHIDRLPPELRVASGHGGSHTHITHEFIRAIVEDRHPSVNIWEAIAYTMPGVIAQQSALEGGRRLKIRDYGTAPA
jgi:hypothetical protein